MELISVIVPVYKVEAYLDKCVQSIVDQTYKNLEIILVDDGSPDSCPAMCDVWAEKDRRIRVIHQPNAGSGAARNTALDAAQGELIAFVDSDDYIAQDMFEHLYGLIIHGADIAECSHVDVFDNHATFHREDSCVRTYTAQEGMAEHIRDRIFRQLIWNKLYRREILGDIRFPVDKKIDDEFFTYQALGKAKVLIRSEKVCYAYRQQPDSVMHQVFSLHRLQAVEAKCQRLELLQEHFPALVPLAKTNLLFTCLYMGQMSLLHMNRKNQQESFRILSSARKQYPLTNEDKRTLPLKQKVWAILCDISFTTACRLRNSLKIGI